MACASGVVRRDSGVAVGNPGNLRASLAPGDDVSFREGRIDIQQLWLMDCEGTEQPLATNLRLELGTDDALQLPAGEWCGLVAESLTLEAVAESEREDVDLLLYIDFLELYGPAWKSSEGDVLLRLGSLGWISSGWLEDDDTSREELAELLVEESALVSDLNRNGQDDGEPELANPDDEAFDWEDENEDEGEEPDEPVEEGCHTSGATPSTAGTLVLLLALLGLRRRSTDAVES